MGISRELDCHSPDLGVNFDGHFDLSFSNEASTLMFYFRAFIEVE